MKGTTPTKKQSSPLKGEFSEKSSNSEAEYTASSSSTGSEGTDSEDVYEVELVMGVEETLVRDFVEMWPFIYFVE